MQRSAPRQAEAPNESELPRVARRGGGMRLPQGRSGSPGQPLECVLGGMRAPATVTVVPMQVTDEVVFSAADK